MRSWQVRLIKECIQQALQAGKFSSFCAVEASRYIGNLLLQLAKLKERSFPEWVSKTNRCSQIDVSFPKNKKVRDRETRVWKYIFEHRFKGWYSFTSWPVGPATTAEEEPEAAVQRQLDKIGQARDKNKYKLTHSWKSRYIYIYIYMCRCIYI